MNIETDTATPISDLVGTIMALMDNLNQTVEHLMLLSENMRTTFQWQRQFFLDMGALLQEESETLKARFRALGERERIRASVDAWFWRPEHAHGMTHKNQLRKRAAYLKATNYTFDQAWDLLCDFVAGWSREEIDKHLLAAVLSEHYSVAK